MALAKYLPISFPPLASLGKNTLSTPSSAPGSKNPTILDAAVIEVTHEICACQVGDDRHATRWDSEQSRGIGIVAEPLW